jgi:hypothetical protein
LISYTKFTFKEFRVCARAWFAFGAGYKLDESDSHAVLASPLTIWSRCAQVIPKSRIMPPPSRQLETSSRHLPPQLTPLAPAWNSRTAVIENHADNRYWERHKGVENRAVSA